MFLRRLTLFAALIFLVASCNNSSTEGRELSEYLSSYLNGNNQVVAFGNAKLKSILNKADYKSVEMISGVVDEQLQTMDKYIDLDGSVYYAATGPLKQDGTPNSTVILIKVKDEEGLKKHLKSEMSYDIEDANGFSYTEDGEFSMGIRGDLAVIYIQPGDYDSEKALTAVFERVDGEPGNGTAEEILKTEGDVLVGMNVSNLYGTAEGDLGQLPEDQRKKLETLFKDAYVQTTFKFENGAAVIETKNFFNAELKKKMFMGPKSANSVLKELGHGNPRVGFAMNLDLKKMEAFMNEMSPEALDKIGGMQFQMAKLAAGANDISDLLTGKMGVLVFGDPDASGALEPDFNVYVGMTDKGNKLAEKYGNDLMNASMMDLSLEMGSNGVSLATNSENAGAGKLNLPKGAENFGQGGVTFFANLEGMDGEEIADMIDQEELATILKVAKFVSVEFNNEGGKIVIQAKDGKENVLKQALEIVVEDLSEQMSNMTM